MVKVGNEKRRKREFSQAVRALETSLEAPLVPGESQRWIHAVREACSQLRLLLKQHFEETHGEILGTIAEEDPGLSHRVEALRNVDRRLREDFESITSQATQLLERIDAAAPDERKVRASVEELSEHALAFVIQVRKQEAALSTWLQEAVNRDRGVVD